MTEIIAEGLEIAIPYEDDSPYEISEDLKTKISKIHKAMGRWAARFRRPANPRRGVVRRVAHARARRTSPTTAARAADSGGGSGDPDPEPAESESAQKLIAYQDAQYLIESKHVHHTRSRLRVAALTLVSVAKSTTQASVSYSTPSQVLELQSKNDGVISHMGTPKALTTPLTPRGMVGTPRAPLLVGLDAEWQTSAGKRRILSVQLSCRCRDGQERVWILWHPGGQTRFEFKTVLGWFLSDLAPYIGYKDYVPKEDLDPYHITLAGHYAIVDLTVAYDRKKILRKTDSLRRTLASVEKPMYQTVWSEDRNRCRPVVLSVRDTMLLAPAGSSVEKLGDGLKYRKLTLPDGHDKGEMERLRREEPAAFVCYAARDAEITRRWIEQMVGSNVYVPVTLGGQAATLLRDAIMTARGWSQPDFDFQWRGLATTAESYADDTGKMRRRKVIVPRPEAALLLTAAGHAYYGGRNEGFLYGIHHASAGWSDFDLAGAYPTAMCLVGDPDYSAPPTVLTGRLGRDMLKPNSWLFGHVRFRFPAGTMYPCLPVKDPFGRGLIFPLEGETWASAPELWLALKAGCEVDLTQPAFLLPTSGHYSLRDGVRGLVQARAEAEAMYGKKSAQALAAKERANSAYGKLAQGLAGKRAFSTRHAATQAIPPSPITSAPQAALTTGLVRAVVSAAMMQLHERGYRVASVTTDGFLTDAPVEVLTALDLYGLRHGFEEARRDLVGSDTVSIWELKHRARSLIMLKTRGGFGVGQIDEHALPSAGAGYKVSGAVKERVEQVGKPAALAELFLNRVGRIGFEFHALPSPRDYVLHGADGVGKEITKEISWEWDYKREPMPGGDCMETVTIDGTQYAHVSYATRPWADIAAFSNARAATDGLSDAVKTTDDVAEVHKRVARRPAAKKAKVRVRGDLARSEAVMVLRGLRSGVLKAAWFDRETVTGREVCERVGLVFGVALGRDDWKNAGRAERSRKVLFVGLAGELAKLGIVINPNPNP